MNGRARKARGSRAVGGRWIGSAVGRVGSQLARLSGYGATGAADGGRRPSGWNRGGGRSPPIGRGAAGFSR